MENASKAMYIAAGVLLGIMILSLGVALFASLRNYAETSQEEAKFNEQLSFNNQFTKYINFIDKEKQFTVTIQDIVTVAGVAFENNSSYNVDPNKWENSKSSLYVEVLLNGSRIDKYIKYDMVGLLENNSENEYKCTNDDVKYSEITGRVYSINFSTIK